MAGDGLRAASFDELSFYAEHFGANPSTGYETLLYDCICGDPTLFQRADTIEDGWSLVDPILDVWKAIPARDFPNYPAADWGPAAAAARRRETQPDARGEARLIA